MVLTAVGGSMGYGEALRYKKQGGHEDHKGLYKLMVLHNVIL